MVALAKNDAEVIVQPGQLDQNPWLLCVENGVVDLRTGQLRQHDPAALMTKLAPVSYKTNAPAHRWQQFLEEIFDPHADLIPFIPRAIGYSLTGSTREECLFLLYGKGRNGKGTFIKKLAETMGDYACTADFSTFVQRRDDSGPRDDIAHMAGKRFVSAQESREGAAIRGTDPAIWSRIKLIPFDVSFEGHEDKDLKGTLTGELAGILTWAVEGCLQFQRDGLAFPKSVKEAAAEYRQESDPVGRFIEERCVVVEYAQARARNLYMAYKAWADDTGERSMSATAFGRRLVERGLQKRKDEKGIHYFGIGFRPDPE